MKTLLLVDGSSYLYRAFHALPDLRTRDGLPTGAIYGVLNMLRRLHKDVQADYSACVFDAKGRTFRDDWYGEYKANRAPMPDDISAQIEPLNECIRALGWPLLSIEGVEADDVIGTLTKLAESRGMRVIISTSDKDIAQLVSPQVTLVNTMSNETLDQAGVEKKFGVRADQLVDYLTLIGDSIDNIPGVDKVGPKTAAKWLAQYGSLDGVLAHAAEIGGAIGENLRNALDWLPQAKRLLTIKCDVELPLQLEDLAPQAQDFATLAPMFERLEFKNWRRELDAAMVQDAAAGGDTPAPASVARPPQNYDTLVTEAQLAQWLEMMSAVELVSVETHTTSLDPMQARLVGLSFALEPGRAAYLPLQHRYAGAPPQIDEAVALALLKPWLEDAGRQKVSENLKYDMHVFANHGIAFAGVLHDTLLQSYVLESHKPHDMGSLAARHLDLQTVSYDQMTGKGAARIGFDQVPVERAAEYAAQNADVTMQLHGSLHARIAGDEKLTRVYREIEMPVMQVLYAMERNGVLLDGRLLENQSGELGAKILELEQAAYAQAGQPFNLNSPKQIQEILFDRLKLPVIKKTPSGLPSTDEDVLAQLARDYPLPKLLLDYRALSKLKSTYTDKLPRMINAATGRVHTTYGQSVAVTGRLASNDPNLQNIPVRSGEGRRIREAFIAPAGSQIVSADYSQIELRIMAHISQDAGLLKAFTAGEDIHRATAAEVFGTELALVTSDQRRYAKVINFGLIYGMSAFGLATQLAVERSAAQLYMDKYFARYPGVADYMARTRTTARAKGYVETVFGRRLWLAEINSGNAPRRQGAERAAINAPMQGTAADLIKLAMIKVHAWLRSERLQTKLIMQVHDELVLEVPEAELLRVQEELPKIMANVAQLDVPLLVDLGVGPNWEKAH